MNLCGATGGRNAFERTLHMLGLKQKNDSPAIRQPKAQSNGSINPSSSGWPGETRAKPIRNQLPIAPSTYYSAFLLHVLSRRDAGWQVPAAREQSPWLDAWEMGLGSRRRDRIEVSQCVHHSGRLCGPYSAGGSKSQLLRKSNRRRQNDGMGLKEPSTKPGPLPC